MAEILPSIVADISEEVFTISTPDELMAFHRLYCGDCAYMSHAFAFGVITTEQFCDYLDRARVLTDKPIAEFDWNNPTPVQIVRVGLARPQVHH